MRMKTLSVVFASLLSGCWSVKHTKADPNGGYWEVKRHTWGWESLYYCSPSRKWCAQVDD